MDIMDITSCRRQDAESRRTLVSTCTTGNERREGAMPVVHSVGAEVAGRRLPEDLQVGKLVADAVRELVRVREETRLLEVGGCTKPLKAGYNLEEAIRGLLIHHLQRPHTLNGHIVDHVGEAAHRVVAAASRNDLSTRSFASVVA